MSWSKSTSGTADVVKASMAAWPQEVLDIDRKYVTNDDTIKLHQRQVSECVRSGRAFADAVPAGYQITVEACGHGYTSTSDIQSDQWSVKLGAYKPAQAAAAAA